MSNEAGECSGPVLLDFLDGLSVFLIQRWMQDNTRSQSGITRSSQFWGTSGSAFINSCTLAQEKSEKPGVPFLSEANNSFLFGMKTSTVKTSQAALHYLVATVSFKAQFKR